jgi:hypothetical protein
VIDKVDMVTARAAIEVAIAGAESFTEAIRAAMRAVLATAAALTLDSFQGPDFMDAVEEDDWSDARGRFDKWQSSWK